MIGPLRDALKQAAAERRAVCLRGGGTKDFYGNAPRGEVLDVRGYAGIVSYEPTELVVTARAGTLLAELEETLAQSGQMLPFEPPHFGASATVGGCVAAGLSGPRRATAGSVRDFVLGARILDGRGEELAFGGQVMKNVAGYDVSRLIAGSMGTLGLILDVSFKVLPRPVARATHRLDMPEAEALAQLNRWGGQPLPLSASAWEDGVLTVRWEGAESAVRSAVQKVGGTAVSAPEADAYWQALREHALPFFADGTPLWRLSLPSTAKPVALEGRQCIEWGGTQRWWKTAAPAEAVRAAAAAAGGHATLFRAAARPAPAFAPLSPVLLKLHRGVKAALDPAGILNPGRLAPEF